MTLGAAWNITNTVILGAFMVVAWREARLGRRAELGPPWLAAVPAAPSRDRRRLDARTKKAHEVASMTWGNRLRL